MARPPRFAVLLLGIALMFCSGAPIAAEGPEDHPPTPKAKQSLIEIPLELGCGKAVFVKGQIRDLPLIFIIDSGGGSSYILDSARGRALGLEPYRRFHLQGGGEDHPTAFSTAGVPIDLPGVKLQPARIVLTDLTWLGKRCGMQIDGMIGYDLFRNYAVEINYSKKMLRLHDSNFKYEGEGDHLPLFEDREHMLTVPAELELPGESPVEVRLVVDTGDALVPIALTREFVDRHQLLSRLQRVGEESRIEGVGGKSHLSLAQVKSLKLGNFLFRDLTIGLSQAQSGGLSEGGYDGIIGAAMLSKFDLIFDLGHRQLIMETNFQTAKSEKSSAAQ